MDKFQYTSRLKKIKKPNTILIVLVSCFVLAEVLFLRPSEIEYKEETTANMFKSIETMVASRKYNDEVGYTIDGFQYTAVEGEVKQWHMTATQATLFQNSKLVLATQATIKMFDSTGKITLITGNEAFYFMANKNLELKGNVRVTFPDGMWIITDKASYSAATGDITTADPFNGESKPSSGEVLEMSGTGFKANKFNNDVYILSQSRVKMKRAQQQENTDIRSDFAKVNRETKVSVFTMKDPKTFVESYQGTLHVRSRKQDATYDSSEKVIQYMTAYDDVLIEELDEQRKKNGLKYATSQKAEFLTKEDKILLSGFPAAYQPNDVLTGDLIIYYRKRNIVEVTQANAVHENQSGNENDQN